MVPIEFYSHEDVVHFQPVVSQYPTELQVAAVTLHYTNKGRKEENYCNLVNITVTMMDLKY